MSHRPVLSLVRMIALVAAAGSTLSIASAQPAGAAKGTPAVAKPETAPAKSDAKSDGKAAAAQPVSDKDKEKQWSEWLENWIHYTRIDNMELARANAKALLDSGMTDEQFAAVVDDKAAIATRFTDTVIKATNRSDTEDFAGKLNQKYENGRLQHARDAAEITRNIKLLTGNQRERLYATERLKFAGEYAMPQLLSAFLDKGDVAKRSQVRRVIVETGRSAIIPLCTALPALDQTDQESVVSVLGDLVNPYPTSLPFLYEVRESTKSDRVKAACDKAILRIAGVINADQPVSQRFFTLATEYYNAAKSVTSFPGEGVQLLWSYDPGSGLFPTPIATPVFHEAMAMRMSERALQHDPKNGEALSLWLASNFSREIDTPQGYDNPAYPKTRRDAMYYAVAAGAVADARVLSRALDTHNTPLARKAIASLERTSGASGMAAGDSTGRKPLLEAVAYPNRRVQYEAALAIGASQPSSPFPGSDRIVPTLASAIRDASARYAVVLTDNPNDAPPMTQALQKRGFTVLPPAKNLSDITQAIAEAPGIDLVVSDLPAPATESMIQEVRGRPGLSATPVLALVSQQGYAEMSKRYDQDSSIRIARSGLNADQVGASAEQLIDAAVGGMVSADEAKQYKLKSLAVLRDLAVSGNPVLKVSFASAALTAALADNKDVIKVRISEVLSYIPEKSVQVAMMDAALGSTGDEQIVLLGHVANSAKRGGNMLEQRQINSLVKMAMGSGPDAQATAAAALMGALNLPNTDLIPLILNPTK